MIRQITNTARDYAWGSTTLMTDCLGLAATGGPMAEVWFGTHPGSMTQVVGDGSLLEMRGGKPLNFLLKILAADAPLSLQAHPDASQAVAGFARENAAGIDIDDPVRNYRDDRHKPEMLVALTPFVALGGFRPITEVLELLAELEALAAKVLGDAIARWRAQLESGGLQALFNSLIQARGELDAELVALAAAANALVAASPTHHEAAHLKLVAQLETEYPGDPGVAISLLCNLVELSPGQAVQIKAGEIHAYVSGLGVEVMASSDNVLRGGLTPKHIDIPELTRVLRFESGSVGPYEARELMTGLWEYPRQCDDFLLYRVEVSGARVLADLRLNGAGILLCTAGEVAVSDSTGERLVLARGQAAYLADAKFFTFAGSGTGYLATS